MQIVCPALPKAFRRMGACARTGDYRDKHARTRPCATRARANDPKPARLLMQAHTGVLPMPKSHIRASTLPAAPSCGLLMKGRASPLCGPYAPQVSARLCSLAQKTFLAPHLNLLQTYNTGCVPCAHRSSCRLLDLGTVMHYTHKHGQNAAHGLRTPLTLTA